ncbi:hypothetical protein TL16_g09998 [Triparma laevis f. inornata]|uniref:UDP-N-acetylglucosamine--peptide N-acetylglucosaminyltransferase SPINDLY n=1 Tax=Triparma laevis f. inornata TaxID=1714386 RepID=A0A9W7B5U9_9STRA|nr:hypothetical protein TL16_g09998 [Triparma laevis f. inornata]
MKGSSGRQRIDRRGSLFGSLILAQNDDILQLNAHIGTLQTHLSDPTVLNKESVHNNLANAYMKCDRIEEAIGHYKEALELNKEDAAAYMNLGVAFKHMNRFEEALKYFEKSLQLRPTADEHYNMANTYLKLSPPNYTSAISHYKEALRMDGGHLNCHQNLGLALKNVGKVDEAIGEMREAVRLGDGGEVNSFYNLGNLLGTKAREMGGVKGGGGEYLQEAVELYREAAILAPVDADIKTNLGITLAGLGRGAEAVAEYFEVMKLQPGDAMTHFNCGNALLQDGDIKGAIEQFKQSLTLDEAFLDAQYNLGITLMEAGEMEEACKVLEGHLQSIDEKEDEDEDEGGEMTEAQVMSSLDDKALIYYNLGTMYSKRGMPVESKEALENSIELKDDDSMANLNLGNQEISLGNVEEGLKQFELAVQFSPDDPSILRNLAYVLIEQGNLEQGAEKLRRCLELSPDDNEIKSYLDQIEEELSIKTKILNDIKVLEEKVATEEGKSNVKDKAGLAMAYRANNEFGKAREQLEQCFFLQPNHPQLPAILEQVKKQEVELAAENEKEENTEKMGNEEIVHATGRFSMFGGKKKGRGKKKGGKKGSGKVAVAG